MLSVDLLGCALYLLSISVFLSRVGDASPIAESECESEREFMIYDQLELEYSREMFK